MYFEFLRETKKRFCAKLGSLRYDENEMKMFKCVSETLPDWSIYKCTFKEIQIDQQKNSFVNFMHLYFAKASQVNFLFCFKYKQLFLKSGLTRLSRLYFPTVTKNISANFQTHVFT